MVEKNNFEEYIKNIDLENFTDVLISSFEEYLENTDLGNFTDVLISRYIKTPIQEQIEMSVSNNLGVSPVPYEFSCRDQTSLDNKLRSMDYLTKENFSLKKLIATIDRPQPISIDAYGNSSFPIPRNIVHRYGSYQKDI